MHLFHKWVYLGPKIVIEPKAGPYDPRSDKDREGYEYLRVCASCGMKSTYEPYFPG